jgi:replicative superfamily II helicase
MLSQVKTDPKHGFFLFILSGEPSRGAHLECLVAKIKHLNNTTANTTANTTNNTSNNTTNNTTSNNSNSSGQAEASERIQLIAMSATVGNLRELAHFLSAELFTDDWRPVRLEEFVKVGRDIFQVAGRGSSSNQCCGSGIRVPF